ncbi:MAG: hypothetical protein KGL39_18415 [Patescibacteria group bacterium]|nr:hypothetical protein [Patescibacteria group bacterium]
MEGPSEVTQTPAKSSRSSNSPIEMTLQDRLRASVAQQAPAKTSLDTPYDWVAELQCRRCGQSAGEGWSLLSQQSHRNRALATNECGELRKGGWSYIYVHRCARALEAGVDLPGVGHVRPGQPVSEPLKSYIDGDSIHLELGPADLIELAEFAEQQQKRDDVTRRRNGLLAQLIFASRHLVNSRLGAGFVNGANSYFCRDCRAQLSSLVDLRHAPGCNAGAVLQLLEQLLQLTMETAAGGYPRCEACGLADGAWVPEDMTPLRARAIGLAENQRAEEIDGKTTRIYTHLCIDGKVGGAA